MKKINLLFLVNDLFINNFESIYQMVKKSKDFNIVVVATTSYGTDYKSEVSSDEIYKFLKSNNIECINSYNKKTKTYIDLSIYNPDYIFVSTPYDIYRPQEYSSSKLSSIAKLCTVEYGSCIYNKANNVIVDNDFYNNCLYNFCTSEKEYPKKDFKNKYEEIIQDKFIPVGCLKLDKYLSSKVDVNKNWIKLFKNTSDRTRVVYKPRWTLENTDLFQKFLDYITDENKNNKYEVLLLEHPLLRSNLKKQGLLENYISCINRNSKYFKIYNDHDFLDYILASDCLIAEVSSTIVEYSITGSPILLLSDYKDLTSYGKTIVQKSNAVKNYDDLIGKLEQVKHKKKIILKNNYLYKSNNKSAAEYLLEFLYNDYSKDYNSEYFKDRYIKLDKELKKLKKIFIQGYYEDILDKNNEDLKVISNGLSEWDNLKNKYISSINKKD